MAGGLLQLVSEGVQNQYLTINPEITFFKTIYRRYTNFGLETSILEFDQEIDFGKKVSVTLKNVGDLMSRTWLHVKFPSFIPDLSKISNSDVYTNYLNRKKIYQNQINEQTTKYQNILIYANLMYGGFQIIEKYRNSINININLLETLFSAYYNSIEDNYNDIVNFIDSLVINNTNIVSYILDVGTSKTIEEVIEISDRYQSVLLRQVKIELNRKKKLENELLELNEKPIPYKWKENLGNYLFTKIQVEIDGEVIDEITSEQMEIYYQHFLEEDYRENYHELISGKSYQNFDLFIPLNFWFCQSFGLGLPLVALKYSPVKLNFIINNVENLITLLDLEDEFNLIRTNTYFLEEMKVDLSGSNLVFNNKTYSLLDLSYNFPTNEVSIINHNIYQENLEQHFNYLEESKITYILENYGSIKEDDSTYSLNQNELENFILSYVDDLNLNNLILEWKYYISRFNQLNNYHLDLGEIYADFIYMDEIEREKFAVSNLNYIINLNQTMEINIEQDYLNRDLEFENYIRDLYWTFQFKSDLTGNRLNGPKYLTFINESYLQNFQIILNGQRVFYNKNTPSYFRLTEPHKHLNNSFTKNIYTYSFALYPEELQPSGGCSFGDIKGKEFQLNLEDGTILTEGNILLKIHARKQLILTIRKGKGKLAFFNKK